MSEIQGNWFTEVCEAHGSAYSLRIHEKCHEEQTPFQRIAIYHTTDFGYLMTIDGFVMVTTRDNFLYHEMMSHPVLFSHPDPRDVVIIGGGDCGTLREVLRHPGVKRAVQVEIDERVTRLAEQYFPELCSANHDPRATLLFDDGIQWVKDAPDASLDVVIIDSTDPVGPAEGLFGKPFYRECLRALRPGGFLVQQSESPLLHMKLLKEMHGAMRETGFKDVKTLHFPQPGYPSGWWSATMARKGERIEGFRERDIAAIKGEFQYYSADMHRGAFAMPAFFYKAVASSE